MEWERQRNREIIGEDESEMIVIPIERQNLEHSPKGRRHNLEGRINDGIMLRIGT